MGEIGGNVRKAGIGSGENRDEKSWGKWEKKGEEDGHREEMYSKSCSSSSLDQSPFQFPSFINRNTRV